MRWLLIVLLAVSATALGDAYVAIPSNTSQALYFPTVDTVECYSVGENDKLTVVSTNRCWPVFLPTVYVEGHLLLLNRPIDQLLKTCAPLLCELRAMPEE